MNDRPVGSFSDDVQLDGNTGKVMLRQPDGTWVSTGLTRAEFERGATAVAVDKVRANLQTRRLNPVERFWDKILG